MTTITVRQVLELPDELATTLLLDEAAQLMKDISDYKRPLHIPNAIYPLEHEHYAGMGHLQELIAAHALRRSKMENAPARQTDAHQFAETPIAAKSILLSDSEKVNNEAEENYQRPNLELLHTPPTSPPQ